MRSGVNKNGVHWIIENSQVYLTYQLANDLQIECTVPEGTINVNEVDFIDILNINNCNE